MRSMLVRPQNDIKYPHRPSDKRRLQLSTADKIIIKAVLNSPSKINAMELQALTSLPTATLQRRRKRIEAQYITTTRDVNLKAVGLMRVHLLIAVGGTSNIANIAGYVINMPFVSKVSRVFGGTKHVLLVEAITRTADIAGIANILEAIRRVEDILDVLWFTDVEDVAKNPDALAQHIGLEQQKVSGHKPGSSMTDQ
jgi:hypothetical protein